MKVLSNGKPAYAGIGSRQTPPQVLRVMDAMGYHLAPRWDLRTGGAQGADMAFEAGAQRAGGWIWTWTADDVCPVRDAWAWERAEAVAPRPLETMAPHVQRLLARNMLVLFGDDGLSPVEWVCCWTPGAACVGGTGHVIRAAGEAGIRVYNLAESRVMRLFRDRVGLP